MSDGRLSAASREAWYAGWDEQDFYLNKPKETPEEEALRKRETVEGLESIKRMILAG